MISLKRFSLVMCVLLIAGFGVAENGEINTDPEFVYVSALDYTSGPSASESVTQSHAIILKVPTDDGEAECIYGEIGASYEDIVLGPDGLLYACDPTNGYIIRFDPEAYVRDFGKQGGLCSQGISDAEVIFSPAGNTLKPQCGWFTHKGGLIFNDTEGYGSFVCRGVANEGLDPASTTPYCHEPGNLEELGESEEPFDFHGEGVTQTARGDLLAVDAGSPEGGGSILKNDGSGQVWTLPMDMTTGEFTGAGSAIIDGLRVPLGVARLSTDDVIVGDLFSIPSDNTDESTVLSHGVLHRFPVSGGTASQSTVCVDFGRDFPYFIEAAADDTVYAVTNNNNGYPSVWKTSLRNCTCIGDVAEQSAAAAFKDSVEECYARLVYEFDEVMPITGIALPPTSTVGKPYSEADPIIFTQFDNALQVDNAGSNCTADLMVHEALQTDIDYFISLLPEEYQPTIHAQAFLGDNGRFQIYDLEGIGANCPENPDSVDYTISSFFEAGSGTPAMIHCHFGDSDSSGGIGKLSTTGQTDSPCTVIPVSNFSLTGIIPDDGRRRGTGPGFSLLVAALFPSIPVGEADSGDMCGLWPIRRDLGPLVLDPDDPDLKWKIARIPAVKMRKWRSTRLKFRVLDAEVTDSTHKPNCWWGPWYPEDLTVAISATRVLKPVGCGDDGSAHDGHGEDCCWGSWETASDPVVPVPGRKGEIDKNGRAVFDQPWRPWTPYLFDWMTGDDDEQLVPGPGIYELWFMVDPAPESGIVPFTAVRYVRLY